MRGRLSEASCWNSMDHLLGCLLAADVVLRQGGLQLKDQLEMPLEDAVDQLF